MVNAKNYAFKVQPQQPNSQASQQAHGTVINCRKPGGKRMTKTQKEARLHEVALVTTQDSLKRKRGSGEEGSLESASAEFALPNFQTVVSLSTIPANRPICPPSWQPSKPPRPRKLKGSTKEIDMDCWFTILSFSTPAQLLAMRRTIPSCYHFLRDNPTLWKHSRNYHYGAALPEPPSELTEFQYADLRHDHGCMSCKAPNTRKTYWAFLRRWCKTCLQSKTLREHDAIPLLRSATGEDLSFLHTCLPSGIFDSWGNFVGVGPATTHALKTVYLLSDVRKIVADYNHLKAQNTDQASWSAELHAWYSPKAEVVEERRVFAHKMEGYEEATRSKKTSDYADKKTQRKEYFREQASKLIPPITTLEMECCPSYRRAVAIPKVPNNISWLQLRPKLEREVLDLRLKGGPSGEQPPTASASGTSTPMTVMEQPQVQRSFPMLPSIGLTLGYHLGVAPPHSHFF